MFLACVSAVGMVHGRKVEPHTRPAYLACSFAGVGNPSLTNAAKSSSSCMSAGQLGSLVELGLAGLGNKKKATRSFSTGSINNLSPLGGMKRSSSSYLRVQLAALPTSDMFNDSADHIDGRTDFIAECKLPTEKGDFRLRSYRYKGAKLVLRNGERVLEWIEMEPVVVVHGDLKGKKNVVVRVHDQCFTSEVLGSQRCDCKEQLDMALMHILQSEGAVIYMPQEGRGIGLANKIAAYELQDSGLDTVDANRHLGFDDDERSYSCVPFILQDIGVQSVQLITNNPYKIKQLRESGVNIDSIKPSIVVPNMHNEKYLRTKAQRMAHLLSLDKLRAPSSKPAIAFGAQSVPAAITSLKEGGMVVVTRGEGPELKAALVAKASEANADTVSAMGKIADGFVTAIVTPKRWEQLGCSETGESLVSVDYDGMVENREYASFGPFFAHKNNIFAF
jgi:GTP cyclohydrolase II